MTETEKMRHAREYLLNLANGVDPISKQELDHDTCLNNVRLSRCFFYVADILKQVIENGGAIGKPFKGGEFFLTDELTNQLSASVNNMQISDFIKPINQIAIEQGMKKIPTTAFTEWLVEKGFMTVERMSNDKRRKIPTPQGEELGIIGEERNGQYGTYTAILYNRSAQQFMIDNLDEIVDRWKGA